MDEQPAPRSEADVLRTGLTALIDRLPDGWSAKRLDAAAANHEVDAILQVAAPDGTSGLLLLEAKRVVEGRDVAVLRERFSRILDHFPGESAVIVSRYLAPVLRDRLTKSGLSFVDATGNVHLVLSRPGLYITDRGADRDPWRGPGRPRGTLKGAPAAKVVRALLDFRRSWTVRSLVEISGASTGSTYRVIEFLETEGLVTRDKRGEIDVPDWVALLRRWSDDYGFVRNSNVTRWIAVRGLANLLSRVAESSVQYAVTGTLAAENWAPYAPARSAMIYVAHADHAAEQWNLREADAGANVMLAEPESDIVFARAKATRANVAIAAPSQVVVDLMTGPGRSPSEAEELIEWMVRNESSWRR